MLRRLSQHFVVCLFLIASTSTLLARDVHLFSSMGVQSESYNTDVQDVAPGDVLVFSDGSRKKVVRPINHGNTTMIFELENGRALRVPLASGMFGRDTYQDFLNSYYFGAQRLADAHTPVVKLFDVLPNEYIETELLTFHFTYDEFLSNSLKIPAGQRDKIFAELIEFAGRTAHLISVEDLHEGNIAYTQHGWLLVDFARKVELGLEEVEYVDWDKSRKLPMAIRVGRLRPKDAEVLVEAVNEQRRNIRNMLYVSSDPRHKCLNLSQRIELVLEK